MTITFEPLHKSHFTLLLKWLEAPHVKKWWDQDVTYTMELVREKYSSYIKGYKLVDGHQRPIQGFIIHNNQNPIGYIQIYNAYDFPRSKTLLGLSSNLGAFDIFIGEKEVLGQGLGSKAIIEFFKLYGSQYSHIFAGPNSNNVAAIKCYEKAGFKMVSEQKDTGERWMIRNNLEFCHLEESENPEVRSILDGGLKDFNKSKLGAYEHDPFTLYIKIEDKVVGGCYGDVTKDNCYIDCIWVDPQYRGKGFAKSIMSKLEMYAKQKNCTIMTLETADFQAKDFYTKIGFSIIDTYPHNTFLGNQVYLMRKTLSDSKSEADTNKILDELKSREPILHHPEKFGKTKQDISKQMCDEFFEVGASGTVYTKKDAIETLLERYNNPNYQDIWETKGFELTKIAPDHYLLTYILIQDKIRVTRRSTIWRRVVDDWKILYHQGTVIDRGNI
jgi:ribosomal protein S18 acetylase RimI-like enzyme